MKKNKTFIKESFVIFFLVLIICFTVFFLFPVFNKELVFWEQNDPLFDSNGSLAKGTVPIEIKVQKSGASLEGISFQANNGDGLFEPETGDWLLLTAIAKNPSSVDYPVATASIKWKTADERDLAFNTLNAEKFQIFVDGFLHTYHINIGESPHWKTSNKLTELRIELPNVSGINFDIQKISVKKRFFPPLDSYINRFFRNNFEIRKINRFFIPAYLIMILFCFFAFSLKFVSKKVLTGKIIFFFTTVILVIFSFYYLKNEFFVLKSYYDSFRKNIVSRDFQSTYLGFYDFKKFILWLDKNTPDDAAIVVLVRGEQIYIMSELAYNLYPKDIIFSNISGKNIGSIVSDIDRILKSSKKDYSYLVSLSRDDFLNTDFFEDKSTDNAKESKNTEKDLKEKFVLENKYRETGGFLYKIVY